MKRRECDRFWEIDAAREGRLSAKDMVAWTRHLRVCSECTSTVAENERIRRAAAESIAPEPAELELRRLRIRVLADAARRSAGAGRRRTATVALAGAIAIVAAAVTIRVVSMRATVPHESEDDFLFASMVSPQGAARWSRARENGVERVRLDDGTLRVHVRHQRVGERFLVTLPDGELEVRGTTFVVTVAGGATARVEVEEGVVAVRAGGAAEVLLGPGAAWEAASHRAADASPRTASPTALAAANPPASSMATVPGTAPAFASASPPSLARSIRVASAAVSAAPTEHAADQAYAAAVAVMQRGEYGAAANAFHDFVVAHPRAPQAEDASYLEAIALARSGREDAAGLAAERHLAQFPASFHRREAAFLAARAARDRGDCNAARALLAPWASSPDARALLHATVCASP